MYRAVTNWALPLVCLAVLLLTLPAYAQGLSFPRSNAAIVTSDARYQFQIEIAATPAHQAQGLMFRKELADDAGMLFDFGVTGPVTMWMKNTFLPLDMLFLAADGTITHIVRDTVPHSLKVITSGGPVRGVFEVPAGTANRLSIKPGDRLIHPLFSG